jgi:hypothetical protein
MVDQQFPPPHRVWFEPLEERETRAVWSAYRTAHAADLDIHELDAAEVYSVEEFSTAFETWISTKSSKRIKLLMVWHAHFLSLACQQVLRRWMEVKSYRCRIWFHMELLNSVQSAILSRCILTTLKGPPRTLTVVKGLDAFPDWVALWKKRIQDSLASQ